MVLCFFSITAHAQRYTFPDKPEEFIGYVADMLKQTKNTESEKVAEIFSAVWDNGKLSTSQKEKIIEVSRKMIASRSTAAGDYTLFYGAV
ncbi:MAG: hypothetical protein HC880_09860 [Bacteroidia bacterium]|nr:hypothetical protein [Bacteroidia bacterium]